MGITILTQFSQVNDITSTIRTDGRCYLHAMFRVGSAVSAPTISAMSMTIALQAMIPGSDDLWCDVQTWSVASTESMSGRDLAYLNVEQMIDYRLKVKSFTSGICQARLMEG